MENKLMVVQQLPVIQERLITIKEEFEKISSEVLSLICNEDTYKIVKEKRAAITAMFNNLESDRKAIKKAILEPYEKLEEVYNQCVKDIYVETKEKLDAKIADVENGIKSGKETEARSFFDEYAKACLVDFVSFDGSGIKVTMTVSVKKLKEQAKEYIDRIVSDMALIRTQPEELQSEMMMEYKACLDVNNAIRTVIERKEKIREESGKNIELDLNIYGDNYVEEKEPLTAPVVEPEPEKKYRMTFTVEGSLEQLKSLKNYMEENKIEIIGGNNNE